MAFLFAPALTFPSFSLVFLVFRAATFLEVWPVFPKDFDRSNVGSISKEDLRQVLEGDVLQSLLEPKDKARFWPGETAALREKKNEL